jgi:hypothetical protein
MCFYACRDNGDCPNEGCDPFEVKVGGQSVQLLTCWND